MTNRPHDDRQPDDLLYNFYDRRLWLTRFLSMEEASRLIWPLCRAVLVNREGVTAEDVDNLMRDIEKRISTEGLSHAEIIIRDPKWFEQITATRDEVNFSDHIRALRDVPLSKTDGSTETSSDSSFALYNFDPKFELQQLLNLGTLSYSLRFFVQGTLYDAIYKEWAEGQAQRLPPLDLIRRIFRCVSNDMEIIQRAITQRSWEKYADGLYRMSAQAMGLLISDKLAWYALAPFQALLPFDHPVLPVTFFSDYTHIHRLPYSSHLLLIGISYDHVYLPLTDATGHSGYLGMAELVVGKTLPAFELMVIPHEVGHYIYHHARLPDSGTFADLSQRFSGQPYSQWYEEIFADLYGCVVTGPLTALALQAMLTSTGDQQICANDGEHPPALVRPFILSEILRVLYEFDPERYPFADVAARLNANWAMILELHGHQIVEGNPSDGRCIIQPHNETPINVAEILESVRPILQAFAEILLHHAQTEKSGGNSPAARIPAIPWSRSNHHSLTDYDSDMESLTSREFVRKEVPDYPLLATEKCQAQDLKTLLQGWGDSGPIGHGDHP